METKILTLIGGISKDSLNQKLFRAVKGNASPGFNFETFDISQLPFFSQDLEEDLPGTVKEFKKRIEDARAILVITPEYNRSFPGVIKNAIDWGSRPYGNNSFNQKPAAIMGASMGNIGTFGAQNHLRQVLTCLNLRIMGDPAFYWNGSKAFDESGALIDPKAKEFIQKYLRAFEKWAQE